MILPQSSMYWKLIAMMTEHAILSTYGSFRNWWVNQMAASGVSLVFSPFALLAGSNADTKAMILIGTFSAFTAIPTLYAVFDYGQESAEELVEEVVEDIENAVA